MCSIKLQMTLLTSENISITAAAIAAKKRKAKTSANSQRWTNAADFAAGVLGAQPTGYQREILQTLVDRRRVCVRGPHGLGKTALASWAVLWGLYTFGDDCKVITTASVWRQLDKFLWPEIRKWARLAKWTDGAPQMQQLNARYGGAEAFAVASDNAAHIEGAHAKRLLYVLDEAKTIPIDTWDAIEGAFSAGECYALAISTPGGRVGRFYDIHRRAEGLTDWAVRHVTLDEAINAGRVLPEWAEQRAAQWGFENPTYQARVLGEFPEQESDALISLTWIESAIERGKELQHLPDCKERYTGVDVARFGSDDSAIVSRCGEVAFIDGVYHGNDTMQMAGRAKLISEQRKTYLHIDEVGVGSGVVDRLKEQGVKCRGVNVGNKPNDTERFANLKAESYWNLREMFRLGNITLLDSQYNDRLTAELTSMRYAVNSSGKITIESKEEIKKQGLRSPDVAEALMLAFVAPIRKGILFA
jgi:hypothetical protein